MWEGPIGGNLVLDELEAFSDSFVTWFSASSREDSLDLLLGELGELVRLKFAYD